MSYESDLKDYQKFMTDFLKKDIYHIEKKDIKLYLKYLKDQNKSPKSISRRISCIRGFYKFLLFEKVISNNPMATIELPKTKKALPSMIIRCKSKYLVTCITAPKQSAAFISSKL